ncbi:MAG: CpaF family protein [Planctomycetes bacterium]|jgi:pilus assembly protein CpaF|nr:CpaF family protein [Phycisphaerae bacterium]NBB96154.1 CpaF family protein [Planctomycetota bacterium]
MARSSIFETTVEHFLSPIMGYMNDPAVSEIMVNAPDEIYIEKQGELIRIDETFESDEALRAAVTNLLQYTGKRISDEHPLIDSRLPDGSRVHVILPPLSRRSVCMTIRKFAKVVFDAQELLRLGSWTAECMAYLKTVVMAEKNLLVAGGTSSGKTCLLNVLSDFIPHHQRIVTIEDSAELEFQQDHVIGLEARPPDRWGRGEITIRDLFRSSLRLRPDRIIVGEVRGGEALEMIQAMTSGHAGSMSTLHANMAIDALNRLETLAMMSKVELPLHALRSQIASAIDVIVLTTRFKDGRRRVSEVAEVLPLSPEGHYRVQTVFSFEFDETTGEGAITWSGHTSVFAGEPKVRLLEPQWGEARQFFSGEAAEANPDTVEF